MDKIVPSSPPTGLSLNKGKLKSTSTPFQQRVNQAKASQPDAVSMPNRLCLMLDRSSSMSGYTTTEKDGKLVTNDKSKISLLKDAIDNFVNRCDFTNTSIAIETFPQGVELALSNVGLMITTTASLLDARGNTPMRACIQSCLEKIPMTRGIIVSDGEATDWHWHDDNFSDDDLEHATSSKADELLTKYKTAQIPIDCVHIGDSSSGEELLRRIAKETGGVYLNFSDVNAFSKGFSYLTPGYRGLLTDGSVSASELGANEVRR